MKSLGMMMALAGLMSAGQNMGPLSHPTSSITPEPSSKTPRARYGHVRGPGTNQRKRRKLARQTPSSKWNSKK